MKKALIAFILFFLICASQFVSCAPSHGADNDTSVTEAFPVTEAGAPSETETEIKTETTTVTKAETATETETETEEETAMVVITEQGDEISTVTMKCGLHYIASNYTNASAERFSFENGLQLDFDDAFFCDFNRFTLFYSSTAPLKICVTYTQDSSTKNDTFYLESGKDSFSALTLGFLDGKISSRLVSITIDTCENKTAEFILSDIKLENVSVPERVCYIEGSKYKLGIDMGWGGSISYVEDKDCPIKGVSNLCNYHDEGRLIQQSYYGLDYHESEYVEGGYKGKENRPYNPVQGGDLSGYDSRLIDFAITENTIYIKAQALDWNLADVLTPSYMENVYTVEDDIIRVYNRFVDFSGWENIYRDQELPALYTINYLDTFVWYNGTKPWTGDTLSTMTDIESDGKASHYVKLKASNTETWCALINAEANYGIGIYTPDVDKFLTMRYMSGQKGYMAPIGNPCSYCSPLNQLQIVSYRPIEYSYILSVGSVEEMRSVFTKYKDFDTNEYFVEYKRSARIGYYDGEMDYIDLSEESSVNMISSPQNTQVAFDAEFSAVKLTVTAPDPYFSFKTEVAQTEYLAEDYDFIEIEYMIPTTNSKSAYSAQFFLCAGNQKNASQSASVYFKDMIKDGQFHTLRLKVGDLDFWSGVIHSVRFDYFNDAAAGDVIYLKSFRLVNE